MLDTGGGRVVEVVGTINNLLNQKSKHNQNGDHAKASTS
jgi:hypothetical protein